MARPKKQPSQPEISDDAVVTMTYKQFMQQQNWIASALAQQQSIASRIHQSSLSNMTTTTTILSQLQSNTRLILDSNRINEAVVSETSFPAIHQLIHTEKDAIQASFTEGIPQAQVPTLSTDQQPTTKSGKPKKARKPKDPNEPKRPITAFFLFIKENKDRVSKEMPGAKPGEIQDQVGKYWRELPEETREQYKQKYRANWAAYEAQMKEYKASGGQVDDADLKPDHEDAIPEGEVDGIMGNGEAGESLPLKDEVASDEVVKTPPTSSLNKKSADDGSSVAILASTSNVTNATAEEPKKKKKKARTKSTSPEETRKEKQTKEDDSKKDKKKKRKSKDANAEESPKKKKKTGKGQAPERVDDYGSDY